MNLNNNNEIRNSKFETKKAKEKIGIAEGEWYGWMDG